MLIGLDNVKSFLRFNNTQNWRIRQRSEKGEIIYQYSPTDATLTDALLKFDEAIKTLSGGTYFIEAWDDEKNTRTWKKDYFEHFAAPGNMMAGIGATEQPKQTLPSVEDISALVRKGIEDYKRDEELARLRAENEELKKNYSATDEKLAVGFEKLVKIGEVVMNNFNSVKTATPAVGNANNDDMDARMIKALEKWQNNEPKILELVEAIAEMSQNDKVMYNMARGMLLKKK